MYDVPEVFGVTRFCVRLCAVALGFAASCGNAVAQTAGHHTHEKAPRSSASVSILAESSKSMLTAEDLRAMPATFVTVVNGHTGKQERYAGPRLSEVLARAGVTLGKETLHGYVVAKGTDGYWVLYSGEEISHEVHAGEVIVAVSRDGQPLGEDGAIKLVSTEDRKPERWVRHLETLRWNLASE